ncbi:MAG: sulfatase [Planctomycetota bacterium]|jgi:arylsulfatase A-like enzyme|nr:sulfatase [Planctomycetota bacterium]
MKRQTKYALILGWFLIVSAALAADRPNVLFIPVDDMNDWVTHLGGHPQSVTPNLDRLARRGVTFTNAHCAVPACNPSRTALLTGLRPSTTGVYYNTNPWRPVLPEVITLPRHFKDNGYFCAGFGKVYHGRYADPKDWHIWSKAPGDSRKPGKAKHLTNGGVGGIRFGPLGNTDEEMVDHINVTRAIEQINRKHDRPWFIACGLIKPHMAFSVPKKYFDKFPLEAMKLPNVPEGDLDDIPAAGVKMAKPDGDHAKIIKSGRWKEAVQAYLATIHFADSQLGRLLDALDVSPFKDNTLICLWSDHGWHLGEKQHWRKFSLWEEATKSPMIWVVPGVTPANGICSRPVDYMNIYPTLNDLCGLPVPQNPKGQKLEGVNMRALLADPEATWNRPALTTYGRNNHAVRSQQYRYIRYADGSEELYDHRSDPMEFKNLAGNPEMAEVKKQIALWLPEKNVPEAPRDKNLSKRKKKKKSK